MTIRGSGGGFKIEHSLKTIKEGKKTGVGKEGTSRRALDGKTPGNGSRNLAREKGGKDPNRFTNGKKTGKQGRGGQKLVEPAEVD